VRGTSAGAFDLFGDRYSSGDSKSTNGILILDLWSLERRSIRLAPSKLLLDHLGKLVVAVMVLKDLDQLSVR
jgi:hypothetical protein